MSLQAFYNELEKHDWFYAWTDDSSVYRRGETAFQALKTKAKSAGPAYAFLMQEYAAHMSSGEPWGTAKKAKPECPAPLSLNDIIELRAQYERLQAMPGSESLLEALLERIRLLAAFHEEGENEPFLFAQFEPLIEAWVSGKQRAIEAHQRLFSR